MRLGIDVGSVSYTHLYPVRADHYFQRNVRKENRKYAGRKKARRSSGAGSEPDARKRRQWSGGFPEYSCQNSVPQRMPGRCFQYFLHRAGRPWKRRAAERIQSGFPAGRLFLPGRPSSQCQCDEKRIAEKSYGASGRVSAVSYTHLDVYKRQLF